MAFIDKFRPYYHARQSDEQSIIRNIRQILATKRTFGSIHPDYGISELSDFTGLDSVVEAIELEVFETLGKYEPRIELLEVSLDEENSGHRRFTFQMKMKVKKTQSMLKLLLDPYSKTVSLADQ